MHFRFDMEYVQRTRQRVAMIVANRVLNDSRVLKTAQTVSKLGYEVCVYGWNSTDVITRVEGHPFEIVLLPNPGLEMKRSTGWCADKGAIRQLEITNIWLRHLQKELTQNRPAFVHTHDMNGLAIGSRLRELSEQPHFLWIHDIHEYVDGLTDIPDDVRTFYSDVERRSIHSPDALTSVSAALNKILTESYSLKTEPALVLNAPRLTDFDPHFHKDVRTAVGIPRDVPLLVYSGNVKAVRGIRTLVEALPALPNVHLAIVTNSSGRFVDELRQGIGDMGVAERVHFEAYVPFMNVTSFLRTATIGIHPIQRYPNAEIALPTKLFEYIHSGIPIVVSNNRAMQEFVRQHDCGFTFEAGNARSLAEAIEHALDRRRCEPSWCNSISSLSDRYCWEKQEAVIAGIYDSLAQGGISPQRYSENNGRYRVLQLPVAQAGQPGALATAMKRRGVSSSSLAIGGNPFRYQVDRILDEVPRNLSSAKQTLNDLVQDYDVFHFHSRSLLFSAHYPYPTGMDLMLLRLAGKKVFFHFRGSDARLPSVFEKCPYNYVSENPNGIYTKFLEDERRVFIEFISGVCHGVFVTDQELQTYVPGALVVPRVVDLKEWPFVGTDPSDVLRVVHAPSRTVVKGSAEVLSAVDKLKSEGIRIEFQLAENLPNDEAAELYRWADVVIDQLRIGWYGVLAVEAMALGKAVVAYIRDDLKHYLPYPLPLAVANPDNLYHVLKEMALNLEEVRLLGVRGRRYVEELHNAESVADILMQVYDSEGNAFDVSKAIGLLSFQAHEGTRGPPKHVTHVRLSRLRYVNGGLLVRFSRILRREGVRSAVHKAEKFLRK